MLIVTACLVHTVDSVLNTMNNANEAFSVFAMEEA